MVAERDVEAVVTCVGNGAVVAVVVVVEMERVGAVVVVVVVRSN